jgi:membrane protease YdiL (CAAX protease family)
MTPAVSLAIFTMGQLILTVAVIWLMRKLQVFSIDDYKFKNIGKGFLLGWVGIIGIIVPFLFRFIGLHEDSFITPNIFYIFIIILHPFIGTAFFEETLFRGLVLKILIKKRGTSKNGIIKACVISSVIFGCVHISNLFVDDVLPVMSNIIGGIAFGVFSAALFLRTGTLWVVILMHGFINLSHQIFNAVIYPEIYIQTVLETSEFSGFIISALWSTITLIAGFVLLRKVNPEAIVSENSVMEH